MANEITLQTFFAQNKSSDIFTIARYIEGYINKHWEAVFQNNQGRLEEAFDEGGDAATYGLYGSLLFKPLNEQLKQAGLRPAPQLPGNFAISREWGSEEERQRWFWSKLTSPEGTALGTIVISFFHDHTQARIPRAAQVLALEETTKEAVVKALSNRSADFKQALEARAEFTQYR